MCFLDAISYRKILKFISLNTCMFFFYSITHGTSTEAWIRACSSPSRNAWILLHPSCITVRSNRSFMSMEMYINMIHDRSKLMKQIKTLQSRQRWEWDKKEKICNFKGGIKFPFANPQVFTKLIFLMPSYQWTNSKIFVHWCVMFSSPSKVLWYITIDMALKSA